jgi:2-dehydropantoate 2-reductase
MPERICIVGVGAIGGLYAAHLARLPELEVWGFDVDADHAAAINRDGLTLVGHVEFTARFRVELDASRIPPCGLGIIATKGTATASAITSVAGVFTDGAVCSVQNGIGNEEVLAAHVPRVMRGVTMPAGRIVAPGVIHMDAPGPTWIGPFEPQPAGWAEVTHLAALLSAAGMESRAMADVRGAQWTKLLFNASTNPLCALTGLTHGQLCDYVPTRRLVGALVDEGTAVARAHGIELIDDVAELIDGAARTNHAHRPSMLQDVQARRATEIATLNGGIVAAGAEVGVPTPLHEAIVDLVRGLELGYMV